MWGWESSGPWPFSTPLAIFIMIYIGASLLHLRSAITPNCPYALVGVLIGFIWERKTAGDSDLIIKILYAWPQTMNCWFLTAFYLLHQRLINILGCKSLVILCMVLMLPRGGKKKARIQYTQGQCTLLTLRSTSVLHFLRARSLSLCFLEEKGSFWETICNVFVQDIVLEVMSLMFTRRSSTS